MVLATNIAETSLTVPGIRYVIDAGTARISRYSHRTKVQRLPIEPVSRASADQRKGRCGRTSDGICIRLYTEEDYASRPEFTDPEILRTNLAAVILQMAALGLGEVAGFPFLDPPDPRSITDGVRLLEELGAITPGRGPSRLTATGRQLARLPVDPRLGRMLLEAGHNGCTREVLIITAALSIVDPRERPADAREAADAQHRRFAEPGSDFLALVALWDYLRDQQRELSSSAFRRMCRREYLHYLRVREWQDVHGQLRQAAAELGITAGKARKERKEASPPPEPETAAGPDGRFPAELAQRVHISLLAGLLSHIGMREADDSAGPKRRGPAEFSGARGARFAIFPDSALARRPPHWVMAAELVETSRLWARVAARIEPEWAEPLAGHLIRRSYSDPHWDAGRGAAMAAEKVTLYGLPIVTGRQVTYARADPAAARQLFIQHALVEGDWQTRHRFFHDNQALLAEAAGLEQRARRHDLVADDAAVYDFYDRRIPAEVVSARHFDTWWKQARQADPGLLSLTAGDLATPAADQVDPADYPLSWDGLPLSYEFAPGEPDDGVTVDIPLARLSQVTGDEFSWLVPGLREELVTELIRSLPKQLRTAFVPAPDYARAVLERLGPSGGDLPGALAAELGRMAGRPVPAGRVRPDPAASSPPGLVPGDRRRRGARDRQGPGRAAAAGAAPAARDAGGRGRPADPDRAAQLESGFAAAGVPQRAGRGLPGAGRHRERRGHHPVRDAGAGRVRDAPGHPAAAADRRAVRSALGGQPAPGVGQAGHEPQPVPQHRRDAGRLRGLRGGPGDRRGGRPGLGRGRLRAAAGGRAGQAGRLHRGRDQRHGQGADRGARGGRQAGPGREPGAGRRGR